MNKRFKKNKKESKNSSTSTLLLYSYEILCIILDCHLWYQSSVSEQSNASFSLNLFMYHTGNWGRIYSGRHTDSQRVSSFLQKDLACPSSHSSQQATKNLSLLSLSFQVRVRAWQATTCVDCFVTSLFTFSPSSLLFYPSL